jgi:sugar lactone lactonase YvrE
MRIHSSLLLAGLLLAFAAPVVAQHTVTTVAGGGSTNVSAKLVSVGSPAGLAIDKAGNIYIADSALNRVYKVTPAGVLTIVAGNGGSNFSGTAGPALSTQLGSPQGVAIDPTTNNIYISLPPGNGEIEEVDVKTGVMSTVYPYYGWNSAINGIFTDAAGNLFVAQAQNCDVIELNIAAKTQKTIAGKMDSCGYSGDGGLATSAKLGASLGSGPEGVFVDAKGNVFIADTDNNVIREVVASSGKIYTVAGNGTAGYSGDGKAATSAELSGPYGVWGDASGNIYIADTGNHAIRKVTGGIISTVVGNGKQGYSGDGGLPTAAELESPQAVLVDSNHNIFIADNVAVREVVAATGKIQTAIGNGFPSYAGDGGKATNAQLYGPSSVFADSLGNLYIADQYNNVVREVVASTGKIKSVAGHGKEGYTGDGGPATAATLAMPTGVYADAQGNVFIADTGNSVIREVSAVTGKIVTVAGDGTIGYSGDGGLAASAQLGAPTAVFVDRSGNLFIADSDNNAIREVTAADGKIKTVAGNGSWGYAGDNGLATSAQLMDPTALFVDPGGNLYIADTGNNVIREVTAATGKIATVAGNGTAGYSDDGTLATNANLVMPSGIFVDGGGNIFFTVGLYDYQGDVVREVSAKTHQISTVAGASYFQGYQDSAKATDAQFDTPLGLSGDRLGNLYVADQANNAVRKIATIQGTDVSPLTPTPSFSPVPGVYPAAQTVTLKDAASGASIYYTTGSTTPTTASTKYKSALTVSATTTINAVALASGDSLSPVAQATYTIATAAPAPTFSPLPGTYVVAQTVTLSTNVAGATIHYTTNGTTPTAASAAYSKPIPVSATTTIKAIAVASGFLSNTVGTAAYKIVIQVAEPGFTPAPRGYTTAQSVTLSDATAGAKIYYTLDSSTPTAKSTLYTGTAIPVSKATTIKAIAAATGDLGSTVATGVYTFDDPTLIAERALAQQGLGIGLATQTFISQLSLAEYVLLLGGDGRCADASATLLSLTSSGHLGGIIPQAPTSLDSPGYATIYYDNNCTKPWEKAELYDWTESIDLTTWSLTGATKETTSVFSPSGAPLGTLKITEAMDISLTGSTMASTYGLGTFAPVGSAPVAQLGLSCSVSLTGFLGGNTPSNCSGGMVQDFPKLNLSLGFILPLSFTPVLSPGVTWTGTQFVAVSASGGIFTSPTGTTWTARTSGSSNALRAVASSSTVLVAVGANGTILTSANAGVSWTVQSSGTKANLMSVVWSGTQFVAVGYTGTETAGVILTSPTGSTWTVRGASSNLPPLLAVAWSGKLFVAAGAFGTGANEGRAALFSSPDGVTWTASASISTLNAPTTVYAVIWSGTQFVAVGTVNYGNYSTVLFSTDGKNWKGPPSYSSVPTEINMKGVAWSSTKKLYVAVGEEGAIITSPDANTWTKRTSNTTSALSAVVWTGTEFLAIGQANTTLISTDGVTWTLQNTIPGEGQLLRYSSTGSSVVIGPLGGLKMTAPTVSTLAITGGTAYGSATFQGYAGDLAVFIPTPTGWTATDKAHNQQFQIAETSSHTFTGSITQISPSKTLATFTIDRSGTGTITYSDGSKAAVTNFLPAD